jgi:hypothetical protein
MRCTFCFLDYSQILPLAKIPKGVSPSTMFAPFPKVRSATNEAVASVLSKIMNLSRLWRLRLVWTRAFVLSQKQRSRMHVIEELRISRPPSYDSVRTEKCLALILSRLSPSLKILSPVENQIPRRTIKYFVPVPKIAFILDNEVARFI